MFRSMIYHPVKVLIAGFLAVAVTLSVPATCQAIGNPDSNPTVNSDDIYCWRNVRETGDFLCIFVENTPYTVTPTDYIYTDSYIWRFQNGGADIGQSLGYAYDESGYGYNVIGFYFLAADAPAWAGAYTLRLSQNPSVFASPLTWSYNIPASAYSSLTDTAEVKDDIAETIISIAGNFYSYWGLSSTTTLVQELETGTVLSLAGQTFFRGAILGIQSMAPDAFPMTITIYDIPNPIWTDAYVNALEIQHAGNSIEAGLNAGESLLDVDYNLFGLMIALAIIGGLILAHWFLAGGPAWKGIIGAAPVLVIGTRMGLVGLGELGLVAAICMIYINARIWKMV